MTQSQSFGKINIEGFEVEVVLLQDSKRKWFCSYVELPNSKILREDYLDYPTFREEDKIGFDTAHSYNEKQILYEKLWDALAQVERAIKKYKVVVGND